MNNWGRDDPIPPLSGIDARLIEAEAKLQTSDIAGHDDDPQHAAHDPADARHLQGPAPWPPLATPADKTTATDLFFREKALWQFERGYRMDDLRRLVRQYGRTQDKVFPTGNFTRNGTPSGHVRHAGRVPGVRMHELNNPNFHGCIDTKA